MQVERLVDSQSPYFEALVAVYESAFPASERKSIDRLKAMIERPTYCFLGALQGNMLAGFSISIALQGTDAGLLEYMAIHAEHRGQGLGEQLFHATVSYPLLAGLHMLIEVELDQLSDVAHGDPARRRAFYKRNGCREIAGLVYRMPHVSEAKPPPMHMMVFRSNLPADLPLPKLQGWLDACYQQVYGVPQGDARISAMLSGLSSHVPLV